MNIVKDQLNLNYWQLHNNNKYRTKRIFVSSVIPEKHLHFLYPVEKLWPTRPQIDFMRKLNLTHNIKEADFVLVPHDWREIRNNFEYIEKLDKLSLQVPILIFNAGDKTSECPLNNCLQLRTHLWPWEKESRKIIIPYPSAAKKFTLRNWKETPTISFMGHLPKLGPRSLFGKSFRGFSRPMKSSPFLIRHIAISKLEKLEQFDIRITKRREFTANASNPNLIKFTLEYESLLAKSDYVLCPRGESNTSIRFFETLSSGATPILINTNGGLPKLPYNMKWDNHILKMGIFSNWSAAINEDWTFLSKDQRYRDRQLNNHNLFKNILFITKYLELLFEDYLKK